MIQMQTSLAVADNSGAKRVVMILPIGGSTSKIARLGDKIKVTCTYMNPDATPIMWGDSSDEEMCFGGMYRYPATGSSLPTCRRSMPFLLSW